MTNENFNINIAKIKARCVEFLNHKRSLTYVSALMSIYTLLAFHYPFFSHVVKNVNHDFSGVWIVISMVILMPLLNYLVYYLLLYLGRIVGNDKIETYRITYKGKSDYAFTYNASQIKKEIVYQII